MSTPESKVKAKLKAYLKARGQYYFMPVQTGYGAACLDFLTCLNGAFIAYETKAEGKELTPRQLFVADAIIAADGLVYKVTLDKAGELEFTPCYGSIGKEVL